MGNASKLLIKAITPTPTGGLLLFAFLYTPLRQQITTRLSYLRLFLLFLLFLNRGSFPLRWHSKLLYIAIKARIQFDLAKKGWYVREPSAKQKELGLKGAEITLSQIGKVPFELVTTRRTRVSFAESDYNL
jgi:hypothetical protein